MSNLFVVLNDTFDTWYVRIRDRWSMCVENGWRKFRRFAVTEVNYLWEMVREGRPLGDEQWSFVVVCSFVFGVAS